MSRFGDASIELDADSNPFEVDIRIPFNDAYRNDSLTKIWRRASEDVPPPPGLRLPACSDRDYALRIKKYKFLDVMMENQYSDAISGESGAGSGHREGVIATHFTLQGGWRFISASEAVTVAPTEAYVRWNDRPWEFEVANSTRALVLVVPIGEISLRKVNGGSLFLSQISPSARLLLAHLKACVEIGEFGISARNATIELFQGMVNGEVANGDHLASALVRAAKEHIESRLASEFDLNPTSVAYALHVSVRTLQRAFSGEGYSVMEYVRSRRLEHARRDLLSTSSTVSEIAARWHFFDSSHFIRTYKQQFDESPSDLRRSRLRR